MKRSRRRLTPDERELAAEFHRRVWELDDGQCCVTGRQAGLWSPTLERHHVIPAQRLRARGFPASVVYAPALGMLVDHNVHIRHTDAVERIPHEAVPLRCREFAAVLGLLHWIDDDDLTYPKGARSARAREPERGL